MLKLITKPTLATFGALILLISASVGANAQERLCDPSFEDCRGPLWNLIDNETVGIDVAFWFMQDNSYANKLINKHNQGVPVRVLVDPRANPIYNGNEQVLTMLKNAGIPMRYNISGGILHWKMMMFVGQGKLEFSGANFSPSFFVYTSPFTNYIDEAIYFTDDPSLLASFKTKYDDLWTNTTRYANYANITGPLTRKYPIAPINPELNWAPDNGDSEFANRAVSRYNAESTRIDVIMYRITDQRHTNAMIAAVNRGVPVRLLTEPNEYRNPDKFWHSWNVDRMYMAGVQVKNRNPQRLGLNHEKAVILHGQKMTIFGSSNWTTSSSNSQEEHNYFTKKQWIFDWFIAHFDRKWNSTSENTDFVPKPPPNAPAYSAPANNAVGLTTNVVLKWEGGLWAHKYDIYFGTTPNPPLFASDVNTGSPYPGNPETFALNNLAPGTTYYWKIVSETMANLGNTGPVWSFTTAGSQSAPATPTGLTASAASSTRINLSWTDVATETGYRVERSPNGSTGWAEIAQLSANQTTYADQTVGAQQTHFYRVRAVNSGGFSGYSNTASATTPAAPPPGGNDVVLWAGEATTRVGAWSIVNDPTAAGGKRISNPDANAAKKTTPLASPVDYFEMTFTAQANTNYRIWLRGKAQADHWGNDSVFVQFNDSLTTGGAATYRIGTTSAAEVNLEDCSGCGLQGWGWQDNGWGVGVMGPLVRFATTGTHTIRIQVKEDGFSIDQIVISGASYLNSSPGALKNDNTILAKSTGGDSSPTPSPTPTPTPTPAPTPTPSPAPTVTSVSPSSGSTAGGASVTITGTNFRANAQVTIGGVAASSEAVVNSTTITCLTPAHAAGVVDVVVTNTDATTGTKTQAYTYVAPQVAVPQFDHVLVVALENQRYEDVMGAAGMPYLKSLANRYGSANQSYANTHPSIGNYFWMTTGQNITNDSNFNGEVSVDNIVRQLNLAGKTWKSYAQSLPSVGYLGGNTGPYVKRHNPFAYFSDVIDSPAQANNIVPFTQFATDLSNNQLPDYAFIIPDQQNNAHDCPAGMSSCTEADKRANADNWLKTNLDPLIASAAFRQNGLLIITFDESVDADVQHGGGHIATVLISPKVPQGFDSTTLYQQQSILRLTAEALGLSTFPGAAASAPNMSEFFSTTNVNTAPSIGSVSPENGPTSGGNSVTISGTGFATGATVSFGGTNASAVVVGSTTINAVAPAHANGTVNVVVTNPGGQSSTLTNGYTYGSAPAETILLADDFNDGSINGTKWLVNNLYSGFTDATVAVQETTQLQIGPLKQNLDGSHYNGIRSAAAFNMTGAYAQVQIVQGPNAATLADAFFTIGSDVNNCYRVYVEGGTLFLQTKFNGVKAQPFTVTFDPVNHAFWRLRHDAGTGNFVFETAPNSGGSPGTWTQRFAGAWNTSAVPLGNVLFELKAGTWRSETTSSGTVSFDNFKAAKP